jgi:hypothetical protein
MIRRALGLAGILLLAATPVAAFPARAQRTVTLHSRAYDHYGRFAGAVRRSVQAPDRFETVTARTRAYDRYGRFSGEVVEERLIPRLRPLTGRPAMR